ncbi:MAG TPA: outer membrane beta-barrel protein [Caulobacter sp.]|nr:outer membrane beta-barrel protein [Caulobacter sp.]
MKTVLITTAGLMVLIGGAAEAAEGPRGYLGGAYGGATVEAPGIGEADADFWVLQGHAALPLGPTVSGEFTLEASQFEGGDTVWSPTARLLFDVGGSQLGGFVGGTTGEAFDLAGAGIEGRFRLAENWRLDGAAGYASGDAEGWGVRSELRIFAGDNTRLDGFAALSGFGTDLGDFQGWSFGVGGEHQFAGAPISLFARFEHSEADDLDLAADTFRIGVRWNFGGGTLRDRYLEGQSAPAFTDLFGGDLLRAAGGIEVEDDDGGGGGGCGDDSVGPCGNTLLDP